METQLLQEHRAELVRSHFSDKTSLIGEMVRILDCETEPGMGIMSIVSVIGAFVTERDAVSSSVDTPGVEQRRLPGLFRTWIFSERSDSCAAFSSSSEDGWLFIRCVIS